MKMYAISDEENGAFVLDPKDGTFTFEIKEAWTCLTRDEAALALEAMNAEHGIEGLYIVFV